MARVYQNSDMRNASGKASWCLDYVDLSGIRKRERTDACSKEDAERLLRKILTDIDKAKTFQLSSIDQLEAMTFSQYVEQKLFPAWGVEYVTENVKEPGLKVTRDVQEIDRGTVSRYLTEYRNVKDTFGKVNLRGITLGMVKDWRSDKQRGVSKQTGRPLENGTINRGVEFIKMVLKSAVPDYIPYNPVVYSRRLRFTKLPEKPRTRKASENEWKLLLEGARTSKFCDLLSGNMSVLLIQLYETLLRPSDVLRYRHDGLLWDRELVCVSDQSKTGRHTGATYASFNARAQAAIRTVPVQLVKQGGKLVPSPFVFVNRETGKPFTVAYLSHAFAKLAESIGSPDLQLRDLRRTGGTYLGERVAGSLVSKALGHTTGAMLKHYVALDESALRQVGRVLAGRPAPELAAGGGVGKLVAN